MSHSAEILTAAPSASASSPGAGWLGWLAGLIFRQTKEFVEEEDSDRRQKTLIESNIFDNWNLVESQEDKLQRTRAKLDRRERDAEVAAVVLKRRPFGRPLEEFATAINTFASAEGDNVLIKHGLDPNSRAVIISKIVARAAPIWLRNFQLLSQTYEGISKQDLEAFEQAFYETAYSKNIVGAIKDIGTFIYHGAAATGLTARIMMDICKRWYEILQRAFSELVGDETPAAVAEVIEKMTFDGLCGSLVRMHIDTARKSGNALVKEGRLPQKWAMDAEANRKKIEQMKLFGLIDAKFGAAQPVILAEQSSSSTAPIDSSKARTVLEQMLTLRSK